MPRAWRGVVARSTAMLAICGIAFLVCPAVHARSEKSSLVHDAAVPDAVDLKWRLCKVSSEMSENEQGVMHSSVDQQLPKHLGANCFRAVVPGTIFANLVRHGTYGDDFDPYFETNLASVPDINTTGPEEWLYFYKTTFEVDESVDAHALLELRSVNYDAAVWFDGQRVVPSAAFPAAPNPSDVEGMFRRFQFPLGLQTAGSKHKIAVLAHPPPNPGSCNGGQGGSHDLAKDGPISQFAAGWDWIQGTPDRNTGLWDKVTLRLTGAVQLQDPFVRAVDIDTDARTATLQVSTSVNNRDDAEERCAIVGMGFEPAEQDSAGGDQDGGDVDLQYFTSVRVEAGATGVDVEFPDIALEDAQLWYPHTHGTPALYRCRIVVVSEVCQQSEQQQGSLRVDGEELRTSFGEFEDVDDEAEVHFGVRKIEPIVNTTLGGLQFNVNGQPTFLNGGNWIATDQLMRFAADPQRALAEVGLHRAMGLNLIRVWGGGITERPEFFDACDKLGVFVFQEFWMTGDNNGRWAGSYDWPLNYTTYVGAVRDTMLMHRNHPSLLFYDAGNELYPTSKSPPPQLLASMQDQLAEVSPDTFFIVSSMTNSTDFNPSRSLAPRDGPYTIMAEEQFYERNPNLWDWHDGSVVRFDYPGADMPFQPEIGSVSHPVWRSLLNFMTADSAASFPGPGDTNVHPTWTYHKFIGFTPKNETPAATPVPARLVTDHIYQYGAPANT